jgi:hypothetical protein
MCIGRQARPIADLIEAGNDLEPTAHVYEVPSGSQIATVVHDRVARSRRLGATLHGPFGFTADGRYLITANSYKVKIWEMERA